MEEALHMETAQGRGSLGVCHCCPAEVLQLQKKTSKYWQQQMLLLP